MSRVWPVSLLTSLAVLLMAQTANAGPSAAGAIANAARTPTPPAIDGVLDEAAWQLAPATHSFTQKFPAEGSSPSEPTTLRILYDDDAIYVSFECVQTTSKVIERLTRRDRLVESDVVSIDLATRGDGKSAFEFWVNASGVMGDSVRWSDTELSPDWDENWEARTTVTKTGWTAEMRIPLRVLRFEESDVASWHVQARRYVSERFETDELAYIPRNQAGEVSHYGRLDGLTGIKPKNGLELRPFVIGRLRRRDPGEDVVGSGTDFIPTAGLDLRWHVSADLTLDATFNPDFAQVEADQVILNLSNYEFFYPEKRPFFLEGLDTFATPMQLVYTRRIGRAPATPELRDGEKLIDTPAPATIYGAQKLVGQLGGGVTVGALSALMAKSDVPVLTTDGRTDKRVTTPLTAFHVLRLKKELSPHATLGMITTAVTHAEQTGTYPLLDARTALCPSGESVFSNARCFHDAIATGFDFRYRSPGGDYSLSAQAIGTRIVHGPARTLADGTKIGDGDTGGAATVTIAKEGGKHILWNATYDGHTRRVDYNDLGYMRRQNQHHAEAFVAYRTLEPYGPWLETWSSVAWAEKLSLDGKNLGRMTWVNSWWRLKNNWQMYMELHARPTRYDDREIGDGTSLERARYVGHEFAMNTDPRGRVQFRVWMQNEFLANGRSWAAEAALVVRALPQLDVELLPTLGYQTGEPRYVDQPGATEYRFGTLRAKSLGATLRATYTFAPRLSLQTYAQLFVASGHYADFSAADVGAGARVHLDELRKTGAPTTNPDFKEAALNVNVVLRWEWTLGSTLYLVYTRAQAPQKLVSQGDIGHLDFGALRHAPAADIFLLKMSYWWS